MRGNLAKSVLKRVCISLTCVVALVGLCWVCYLGANYWRVEHAISHCQTAPSQTAADTLVELIDNHIPTAQQGERILKLLLTPNVITRKTYRVERYPTMELELPFTLSFRNGSVARCEQVLGYGDPPRRSESTEYNILRHVPRRHVLYPVPQEPATYDVEIQQRYTLNLDRHECAWSWHPLGRPFPRCLLPHRKKTTTRIRSLEQWDYACTVTARTQIIVVEESQAERIELISSPDLDAAMEAAFRSGVQPMGSWHPTAQTSDDGLAVWYRDLPASIGFTAILHLSDGREIPDGVWVSDRLYARARGSGQFVVSPSILALREPGSYTGSIMLRPDPNAAYEDPAIKTIWNGTLAFPISFTISTELNSP